MDLATFKPLMAWLHEHPQWGGFITFLFAFGESIAVIGLVIPGSVVMSLVGVLVGAGVLPLGSTIIWGIVGGFLGDICSYWFGHHYKNNIRILWPFRLFPNWLDRGERFFQKHGGKSVFIGRFIGPLRPILPITAGTLNMPKLRFFIVDGIAAILWAPLYMLPGFIIGAASLALPPEAATQIIIYLVILLIIISLFFWLIKKLVLGFIYWLDRVFYRFWQFLLRKKSCVSFCRFVQSTHIPDDHSQLGILIFMLMTAILFLIVTINVATLTGIEHINDPLHVLFRSLYTPLLKKIMLMITYIGTPSHLTIFWLVILLWLSLRRYWYTALHWMLLGFFAIGSTGVIKRIVAFPRPEGIHVIPLSYSYPSGHTSLSTAFFGFLAVIIARERNITQRWLIYIITGLLILCIALSRLFLGTHWTTDVIGGLLLGLFWVLIFALSYRRQHVLLPHLGEFLTVIGLSLLLLWSYTYISQYKDDLYNYTPSWMPTYIYKNTWWHEGINNAPLYRDNRLGKKVQTMNLEWLSNLATIKAELIKQGWQEMPKSKILTTLKYLGNHTHNQTLPLLTSVYRGQKPVLELIKPIHQTGHLLILRLWHSHIVIMPDQKTLWVGTLNYQRKSNLQNFLSLQKKEIKTLPSQPVIELFSQYLKPFRWRLMHYFTPRLNDELDLDWNGQVLLIQSR